MNLIALVDSSKFANDVGVTSLNIGEIGFLIIDSQALYEDLKHLQKGGMKVVIV